MVYSPDLPSYVTFKTLGNVFGIDGSSVRRLILKRFKELSSDGVKTRRQKLKESELPIRQRYGYRFLKPEHIEYLVDPETLN